MERWTRLSEQTLVENSYLTLKQVRFRLPTGTEIPDYFLIERGNYILAVVVDENGRMLLEKQYRPAVDEFVYEIPAGWIDPGETAEDAGKREVYEETGYRTVQVEALGSFYPLAGLIKEEAFAFLVVVNSTQPEKQRLDEKEEIEVSWYSPEQVQKMIRKNQVKCMGSLAALHLYWNSLGR